MPGRELEPQVSSTPSLIGASHLADITLSDQERHEAAVDAAIARREPQGFKITAVSLDVINVLPQTRRTFTEIPILADSMVRRGILNAVHVAQLDDRNLEKFLSIFNQVQKSEVTLSDLVHTPDGTNVLIAGERRLRAVKYLHEQGCSDCQELAAAAPTPEEADIITGGCYAKHFDTEEVVVNLGRNISAKEALKVQSDENTHVPVPPHEDALFINTFWQFMKSEDPEYRLSAFAKDVGRSLDVVRNAINYSNLPPSIRERVERPQKEGKIPYGIAVEISRLTQMREAKTAVEMLSPDEAQDWITSDKNGKLITGRFIEMPEDQLERWVTKYFLEGYHNIVDFREAVSNYIKGRIGGQANLFDLMVENVADFDEVQRRLVVNARTLRATQSEIGYLEGFLRLVKEGKVGLEDSVYASGSGVRNLLRIARLAHEIAVELPGGSISRPKRQEIIDETDESIKILERLVTEIDDTQQSH